MNKKPETKIECSELEMAYLTKDELKTEFLEDLNHCYKYFTKLTLSNLIEKWEGK